MTLERVTETEVAARNGHPKLASSPACLVHIYPVGPGLGSRHALTNSNLMIGRGNDCHVCLEDKSVSRHHCLVQREREGYFVTDLGSTNGTFINDLPVAENILENGDHLRVGCYLFRFLAGNNVETQYYEEIHRLTIIDSLTGVHNKRYLLEYLDRELTRSVRHRRPVALIMLDIDHFKTINDQFGHLAGDLVLHGIAACVRDSIRKEELLARYGGEEFALVLPEESQDGAVLAAERIRGLVAHLSLQIEDKSLQVTISLGVACSRGNESLTPMELIRRADEKLYLAKREGRNCVRC
jgi:two-component system cell cycle response regulator